MRLVSLLALLYVAQNVSITIALTMMQSAAGSGGPIAWTVGTSQVGGADTIS